MCPLYFLPKWLPNGLRYEHVAGFGAMNYQNTPKIDARLNAK